MKLKEYLKSKKKTIRAFSKESGVSRYSIIKYKEGSRPAPIQAWKIFNATSGDVSFEDMGFSSTPKKSIKEQ